MRRKLNSVLIFAILNCVIFSFNNCSPVHDPMLAEAPSSTFDVSSPAALKAQQILSSNCASCHGSASGQGGVSNITNLTSIIQARLITPGNSAGSAIIIAVKSSAMPPTGPLNAADIASLEAWVDEAGPTAPSPAPTPSPGGTPVSSTTYASISAHILTPKCVACHGPMSAGGGFRFDSYANSMMAVQANNLAGSLMYTQTASGSMPQGGPILSTADLESISQWIINGAKNN